MSFDIVIVGGGFGGLEAAFTIRSFMGDSGAITLIDRQDSHSFIPSIHEVISGKIDLRSIQIPLRTILAPSGIRFVRDEVTAIDPRERRVTTAGEAFNYDCILLAAGAENNFFGVPGAKEFTFRFRTPDDAVMIRENLARLLANERSKAHLVLAGGGTEGVEVAGELLDLVRESRVFDDEPSRIAITLVEAQPHLLPGFPPSACAFAENYLQGQGVEIITGERIASVNESSIVLASGRGLPQSLLIWTGGIKPSRLVDDVALPKDPDGWLIVDDRLRSPDDERFYAVGDVVSIQGLDGKLPIQRLAYHAQDQAVVAGTNISHYLRGKKPVRYEPRYKPQLISIGKNMGIFTKGSAVRTGAWVVGLKKAVERRHLMSSVSRPLISGMMRQVPARDLLMQLGLKLRF